MLKEISNREAQGIIEAGGTHYVLDVRTPAEYAEGHIPNVHFLNVQDPAFAEEVKNLPTDKPWLVYCRSGARSSSATRYMNQIGFDATNVQGGIMAWQGAVVQD